MKFVLLVFDSRNVFDENTYEYELEERHKAEAFQKALNILVNEEQEMTDFSGKTTIKMYEPWQIRIHPKDYNSET